MRTWWSLNWRIDLAHRSLLILISGLDTTRREARAMRSTRSEISGKRDGHVTAPRPDNVVVLVYRARVMHVLGNTGMVGLMDVDGISGLNYAESGAESHGRYRARYRRHFYKIRDQLSFDDDGELGRAECDRGRGRGKRNAQNLRRR